MNRPLRLACLGITVFSFLLASPSLAQIGVCCFPDCTCILTTEEECAGYGGYWMGDLYDTCLPNPCDCPPGACCLPDGSCFETAEFDCIGSGGDWLGGGLPCDPDPCPQIGACCYVNGICVLMTFEECLALEQEGACLWLPEDRCDPNPCPNCPTIACCLPDGICRIYCEYGACEEDGGEPVGCFCELHPCPRIGACCLAGGYCELITPTDCELLGGEYIGHEVPCDPDPCGTTGVPGSSTETVTWGRIKSRYR